MHIGIQFPTSELPRDPGAIREFVQGAEALGFHHLTIFEHVLGTSKGQRSSGRSYDPKTPLHEPFVLFGFIAAVTDSIELVTSILVLPQRQTALVAKQAAELDVLSRGRLRLGVGVGWNEGEYEGLGADFHTRGDRIEEQVEVLRLLWTNEAVTYLGNWHHLEGAGITVLPVQRPIPIWMGGGAKERVLRRIGRLADGWIPGADYSETRLAVVRAAAQEAGRAPADVGLEGRLALTGKTPEQWREMVESWRAAGASHVVITTYDAGFTSPSQHLGLAERFLRETRGLISTAKSPTEQQA